MIPQKHVSSVLIKRNLMCKRLFVLFFLLGGIFLGLLAEPSGRGYDPDAPNIGLPEGNEVLIGLIIAIIAIPIGYLILNAGKKENSSDESFFPGCLGLVFIGGGALCLLPLAAWVFSILSALYAVGIIIFVVIVIIAFLFSIMKK